jgi:alpha-ketoglutarate-dependent taurine dioxygenase
MRAAFDALDQSTQERILDMAAYHSLFYSQAKVGHKPQKGASYGLDDQNIPLRPLVKIHPVTGCPTLFIGRHAHGIPGLSDAESESLLEELTAFACQPPRVFAHKWQSGDVVMWDNRCVLHRARPYDYSQPRIMRHVRVAGDPISEAGINPS